MKAGVRAKTIVIFVGVVLAATAGLIAIYAFSGEGDGSQAAKDEQTSPSGQASPPGGTGSGTTWSSNRLTLPQQYQQTNTTKQKFNGMKSHIEKLLALAANPNSNLGERTKCIMDVWASAFTMMHWALGKGEENAAMEFICCQMKQVGELGGVIMANAKKEAEKVLDDAMNKKDPNEQLECTVQALEKLNIMMKILNIKIEVFSIVGEKNTDIDKELKNSNVILKRFFNILKNQNDDDESKKLNEEIYIFLDIPKNLSLKDNSIATSLQNFKTLFLRNVSSKKIGISDTMTERIIDAAQNFIYEWLIKDGYYPEEIPQEKRDALNSSWSCIESAIREILKLEDDCVKAFEEVNKMIEYHKSAIQMQDMAYAQISMIHKEKEVNKIKDLIKKMKEQRNKVNENTDKLIKMFEEEEQAKADREKNKKPEDAASDSEQGFGLWMNLLQKRIAMSQTFAVLIMGSVYQNEQGVAKLK